MVFSSLFAAGAPGASPGWGGVGGILDSAPSLGARPSRAVFLVLALPGGAQIAKSHPPTWWGHAEPHVPADWGIVVPPLQARSYVATLPRGGCVCECICLTSPGSTLVPKTCPKLLPGCQWPGVRTRFTPAPGVPLALTLLSLAGVCGFREALCPGSR